MARYSKVTGRWIPLWAVALAAMPACLGASAATAEDCPDPNRPLAYAGWGLQAGFSSQPDQIILGGHLQLEPLAPSVRLDPTADLGFGDHHTLLTINGDLTYRLAIEHAGHLYMGGSLGLIYLRNTRTDDADLDMGAAAVVGYDFPTAHDPVFLEVKIGLTSFEPDMKLVLGYTFLE